MERVKTVMEILDKMNFFQGQRAGRELWNDKPFEVQEEDLENFKRDINTIGSYIWEIVKELKQYRDAEEQGLLLRLPCKVGDTIYRINQYAKEPIISMKVLQVRFGELYAGNKFLRIDAINDEDMGEFCYLQSEFGINVFFTKEEAEQALAKMKEV